MVRQIETLDLEGVYLLSNKRGSVWAIEYTFCMHVCACMRYVIPHKNYFTIQELCFFGKSTLLETDSPCPVFLDMFTSLSLGFSI